MKDKHFGEYTFTCSRWRMRRKDMMELLRQTYWANTRTWATQRKALNGSLAYAVLDARHRQVGMARVITDCATTYYLADVVIDEKLRGKGIGQAFIAYIMEDERFNTRRGLLLTRTAQGFYEHVGFFREGDRLMLRDPTDRT